MKKLINSRSKEEIENFIQANLRIITSERVFQKILKTVSLVRNRYIRLHSYYQDKGSYIKMAH